MPLLQRLLEYPEAHRILIRLWRDSKHSLESALQMRRRQLRLLGKKLKRQDLISVCLDEAGQRPHQPG